MTELRINELRENCEAYGTSSMINSDLLYLAVQPVNRENLDKLLDENTIVKIGTMSIGQLSAYGFTKNQSVRIMSVFEVARRWSTYEGDKKARLNSPKDVYNLMFPKLRGMQKERFIILIVNTKNEVIKEELISIGSLNASIVHPREVFKPAIENSASGIFLIHNHPSGDPCPSREDIMITEKLIEGGKLLGIDVLDHVIIGEGKYVSLKTEGYIH